VAVAKGKTVEKQSKRPGKGGTIAPGFPPGQSGNPNGRPKKLLSTVNDELKALGYELIKPSHLAEGFQLILNLDEAEIEKLSTEKSMPIFVRILARNLTDKKMDYFALNDVLNRIIGKPKGSLDVTTGGEKITTIDPKQLSTQALKEILKAKKNAESE
jgi:hypothetical protein